MTTSKTEQNMLVSPALNSQDLEDLEQAFAAVEAGDKAAATAELANATKVIEMAASKGVYHKNNVARKVSRLNKAVNKMA